MLEHRPRTQVAQLGLDESSQVAGRAVFHAEHGVQIIVVLDDHAGTELGGRDRHRLNDSPYRIAVCGAGGRRARQYFRPRGLKHYFTRAFARKETFPIPDSSQCDQLGVLMPIPYPQDYNCPDHRESFNFARTLKPGRK